MGIEAALGLGYGLVALLAMIPTWLEQGANGIGGLPQRLAGLAACLLWPLTAAVVAALAWRAARQEAGTDLGA